eukprot:m.31544 g.31544  ORF g.31544 m.31544 type:complete len:570 (+) comp8327_c0_seq3:51-1760(+)
MSTNQHVYLRKRTNRAPPSEYRNNLVLKMRELKVTSKSYTRRTFIALVVAVASGVSGIYTIFSDWSDHFLLGLPLNYIFGGSLLLLGAVLLAAFMVRSRLTARAKTQDRERPGNSDRINQKLRTNEIKLAPWRPKSPIHEKAPTDRMAHFNLSKWDRSTDQLMHSTRNFEDRPSTERRKPMNSSMMHIDHMSRSRIGMSPFSPNDTLTSQSRYTHGISTPPRNYVYSPSRPVANTESFKVSQGYAVRSADQVWRMLGFLDGHLDRTEDILRNWLARNVVQPVVSMIDDINHRLEQLTENKYHRIGSAGLPIINQIQQNILQRMSQPIGYSQQSYGISRHFDRLMKYLEPWGSNEHEQAYLVSRLRDLAKGGRYCWNGDMDAYRIHNKLDNVDRTQLPDNFPTDAEILMHFFCCFLSDSENEIYPTTHTAHSFANLHFMKANDTFEDLLKREQKSKIYIRQLFPVHPPSYQIVEVYDYNSFEIWNIREGRLNLFHTLLVFLKYIRDMQDGDLDEWAHRSIGTYGLKIDGCISEYPKAMPCHMFQQTEYKWSTHPPSRCAHCMFPKSKHKE